MAKAKKKIKRIIDVAEWRTAKETPDGRYICEVILTDGTEGRFVFVTKAALAQAYVLFADRIFTNAIPIKRPKRAD